MFEALVMLCMVGAAKLCHTVVLPGYEAQDARTCQAALEKNPPSLGVFTGFKASGAPYCDKAGPALDFTEVAPGVYVHRGNIEEPDANNKGDVSNIAFVVGDTAVAVIDSGTTRALGEGAWRAIRAVTHLPVAYVVLTHMHPDHVLGAAPIAEAGAMMVGHTQLNNALSNRVENYLQSLNTLIGAEAMFATRAVPATIMVEESSVAELDLGNRVLVLTAWPNAHTGTDLTVFDPHSGILFAGDLVFDQHTPALDGSLRGWQTVLAALDRQDIAYVVPGHGGPLLKWPDGGKPLQRYLATLASDTRKALDAGERLGDAVQHVAHTEAEHWELFDAFNPRNATVAFTELEWE